MRLVLFRFRKVRGTVIGRLCQEIVDRQGGVIDHERLCDTVEREGGNVAPGEYRVQIGKCQLLHRKMLFLQEPSPSVCKACRAECRHHERGHLSALHSVACPMLQPGNGPFTLRQGGILVGEACPPGFVVQSQDTFLLLYDRIKKATGRKGEVTVEVREVHST